MQLTRDKIQRMIGATAGSVSSYSGGGGAGVAGVTPAYYNQNFTLMYKTVVVVTDGDEVISTTTTFATAAPNEIVAVGTTSETDSQTGYVTTTTVSLVGPQAQNALVIGDLMLVHDTTNNALYVVNKDGATAANFYATGGVSALGYSGGGGGTGGATTLDELDDVVITSPTSGQVLTYNGSEWVNSAAGATGLTSIGMTVPTGFSVSPASLTANGTFAISFASGYSLPTTEKQSQWDAAYGWGNHANAGYLTSSALSGYATQTWVENKGYLTSSALSGYATQTWVSSNYLGINGTAVAATKLATAVYLWGNSFDGSDSIGTSTSYKSLSYVSNITMSGYIQIGSIKLSYDSTNKALKVEHTTYGTKANIYATGGISALGYGSGSGGSGATTLDELDDVVITSPTSGQVLTYNGSEWVNSAAGATGLTRIGMTVPTGFAVSPATLSANGTFAISFASGYSLPTTAKQSNWDTAYGWGNHANAGYLTSSDMSDFSITIAGTPVSIGGSISAATIGNALNVNSPAAYASSAGNASTAGYATEAGSASTAGYATDAGSLRTPVFLWGNSFDGSSSIGTSSSYKSLSYVNSIAMNGAINGAQSIELNNGTSFNSSVGGFIDFHFAGPSIDYPDYTSRICEYATGVLSIEAYAGAGAAALKVGEGYNGSYLQIGLVRLVYDSNNNALKVVKVDGSAANLYATGGLSALGFSGGTSSMDSFAFNYLTVNNRLTFANNASIYGYGLNFVRNSASTDSPITLFYSYTTSKTSFLTYYYTQYDKVGLRGNNENSDTWWIDPDGCARFTRLYLDNTRYLYLSGSSLKYYNGSSYITIA